MIKNKLTIILILFTAAVLRFYQLGSNPPSLDWDEVSLAYNAKAILQSGRDEYGNFLPITIRSFNDYKPSLYTYTLVPTFAVFGQSEFAIRFPSALAGVLTVLFTYLLVKQLFSTPGVNVIALLSALLLAISPWHTHVSRVAFEANLGLTFFIAGVYLFLKSRTKANFLVLSALSFALSLHSYHSSKLIIPLLLIFLAWPYKKLLLKRKKPLFVSILIAVVFVGLVWRTVQIGVGQSRFNSVSFMTIDNLLDVSRSRIEADNFSLLSRVVNHRYLVYAKEIAGGYFDHFTFKYWFIEGDSIARSTYVTNSGLLLWWSLPFLLLGLFTLPSYKSSGRNLLFAWFFVAPTASALTSGTPNALRSIFFLPTFQIFTALGILKSVSLIKSPRGWLNRLPRGGVLVAAALFSLFAVANILSYFHNYYRHAPTETAPQWQYGYKQMVQKLMPIKDNYSRIIITNAYDQPYIYLLWYGLYSPPDKLNPGDFAAGFDNFEFRPVNWGEDINFRNTLLIGTPEEIKGPNQAIWQVDFPDGAPAFLAVASLR